MTIPRRVFNLLLITVMQRAVLLVRCVSALANDLPYKTSRPWGLHFRGGSSSSLSSQTYYSGSSISSTLPEKSSGPNLSEWAEKSLGIVGSYTPSTFGGVRYWDTSKSSQFRVLFVLGGPGAGKGTQSDLLLENYACVHFSVGQLLREEQEKQDSPHRAVIEDCLVSGNIVPVEISLSLLEEAMKKVEGKSLIFLVDGFPRNFDNLDGWNRCMNQSSSVWGVLSYQCPMDELERRILSRGKDSGRSDDNLESARKRFATFERETVPVVDTLRLVQAKLEEQGGLVLQIADIRGDQSIDDVWKDTQTVMNNFVANDVWTANAVLLQAVDLQDVELYQAVCAEEFFSSDESPADVLARQEGSSSGAVSNAEIEFITGTKASVSYDRVFGGEKVRETRIWSHRGENGWQNIHFFRKPVE